VKGLKIQRNEHVIPRLHDLKEISLATTEDSCNDLVKGRGRGGDSTYGLLEYEEVSLLY